MGETWGRRVAKGGADAGQAVAVEEPEGERVVVMGFGRVGRLVADMLSVHGASWLGIDTDPAIVKRARNDGLPVLFGNVDSETAIERLGLDNARAMILTMDEPVLVVRMVKKLRSGHPDLPIIVRARDTAHAAELYKAGATHAVPETLESSLQLSEAVLVDLGFPMGVVIASIHEKRDEFREQIMEEGGLTEKPRLKSASLRERSA